MNRRSFLRTNLFVVIVGITIAGTCFGAEGIKEGDVAAFSAGDHSEFTLITALGWVRFTVPSEWKVSNMETKGPDKVALFQISDDSGEASSANVVVILYQSANVFSEAHQKAAVGEKSRIDQWEVFKRQAKQDDTTYSVWIAFREIADVHVAVRLAWPRSSKNSASPDSEMAQTFRALLKSVTGELGPYERRTGEVVRSPD